MKKTLSSLIFAAIVAGSAAAQAGTILVGTDAGLAPFEFKDQKSEEIVGFDMDIIKAVARAVGDEAKIQNMQFAGIIPALQTNMIDVAVAAITITDERKKQVLFSDPYYDVGLAMVIKAANKDKYAELKDIEGKAICAQIGSTGSLLAQSVKGAKVMNFDQVAEALMELKMGGCEAALLGDTTARHYQSQHNDKDLLIVPHLYNPKQVGFAVSKNNKALVEKLNKGLAAIKASGEYDKIYEKWLGKKMH